MAPICECICEKSGGGTFCKGVEEGSKKGRCSSSRNKLPSKSSGSDLPGLELIGFNDVSSGPKTESMTGFAGLGGGTFFLG